MSFFQNYLISMTRKIGRCIRHLIKKFQLIVYSESGMTLVETIIVAGLLAGVAFGATYFLTQGKVSRYSTSELMECQMVAKEALEQVVSLGTRLYGYKIRHSEPEFSYDPLLIGVEDGRNLTVPSLYTNLFKQLGVDPLLKSPTINSGVPIIKSSSSTEIEIGTSAMLVNSVNALQYLYNSDPLYSTGPKGKKLTNIPEGVVSKMLKAYSGRFNLKDVSFYVKITPIDLKTNEPIQNLNNACQITHYNGTEYVSQSCPQSGYILTRPHFGTVPNGSEIPSNLKIIGNPDIGFEIKVSFEYKQNLSCDMIHRFSHSIKPVINRSALPELGVKITGLTTGAGKDLMGDPFSVSCNTDPDTTAGSYDDIIATLDFNDVRGSEIGTVLLCRMNSYCGTFGNNEDHKGTGCSATKGVWQRCHDIKPIGSNQGWTPKYKWGSGQLELTFEEMQPNKRYDFTVGEFSMAGNLISISSLLAAGTGPGTGVDAKAGNFIFYIDETRPVVKERRVKFNSLGIPTDGENGRNYQGPQGDKVEWKRPDDSLKKQWLQCNNKEDDDNVHFVMVIEDEFTHNILPCKGMLKAMREDGKGKNDVDISYDDCVKPRKWVKIKETWHCLPPKQSVCEKPREWVKIKKIWHCLPPAKTEPDGVSISVLCEGVIKKEKIQHGRHTLTLTPSDSCGASKTLGLLVWDTDLPETFEPKASDEEDFRNLQGPAYSIKTVVPGNAMGKFPKHYVVDCDENYINDKPRKDGDGEELYCSLSKGKGQTVKNGCNPAPVGIKYYHVCGGHNGNGGNGTCRMTTWSVYVPKNKTCGSVKCEPDLNCCQSPIACGSRNLTCFERPSGGTCSRPLHGKDQDAQSGCPHLGFYDCEYELHCGPMDGCGVGVRQGEACTYPKMTSCNSGHCSHDNNIMCTYDNDCFEGVGDMCMFKSGGCKKKTEPINLSQQMCPERKATCP